MKTFFIILFVVVGSVALMMAGLGIKMLCHRSAAFNRPCTNADSKTGRCAHCSCGQSNGNTNMFCKNKQNGDNKNNNL